MREGGVERKGRKENNEGEIKRKECIGEGKER